MIRFFFCSLLLIWGLEVKGQQEPAEVSGSVSYITSQNVYVRFADTDDIDVGDTLYYKSSGGIEAALIVIQKSSTSCITKPLFSFQPNIGQWVFGKSKEKNIKIEDIKPDIILEKPDTSTNNVPKALPSQKGFLENLRGNISASSYNYFDSGKISRHTEMMRLALQINQIANSKFSTEMYLNYRNNMRLASDTSGNKSASFNVYNLLVKYEPDSSWSLSLGRQISNNFSSVGAVDGFLLEKRWRTFFAGAIVGFRPDMYNYSFNKDLFEYGGYGGYNLKFKNMVSKATIGLIQQTNSGSIDRRFAFGQLSMRYKKLNVFSSADLDLFQNINGVASTTPRLTNFYASSQYRLNRYVSFNMAYDNRKRILYYDTEKEFIETWLLDDVARQGARIGVRFQPIKNTSIGATYGYRFQENNQSKSQNINGYISHYNLPVIKGSITLSYYNNTTNYLKNNSYILRYGRNLYRDIVYTNFYARRVIYSYLQREDLSSLIQSYYGCDIDVRIKKNLRAGIMAEINNIQNANDFRMNLQISRRF